MAQRKNGESDTSFLSDKIKPVWAVIEVLLNEKENIRYVYNK